MSEQQNVPPSSEIPNLADFVKVRSAIESLYFPNDIKDRAADISRFDEKDILAIATLLHTYLAPDVSHEVTTKHMFVVGREFHSQKQFLAAPDERTAILQNASNHLKELWLKMKEGEEEQFLIRASNIIAIALVCAHLFEDGNGRTARTIAHIIRVGTGPGLSDEDLILAGSNRPSSGFRINSYVPTGDGVHLSASELMKIAAAADIPIDDIEEYKALTNNYYTTPYGV